MNDGSLAIRDVTVRFGGLTALDEVSLPAAPRQITGIIGPNGAGKTTLLNTACGFVRPQTGTVSFDGRELNGLGTHRLAALGLARALPGGGPVPRPCRGRERQGRRAPQRRRRDLVGAVRAARFGPGRTAAAGAGADRARASWRGRRGGRHAGHGA